MNKSVSLLALLCLINGAAAARPGVRVLRPVVDSTGVEKKDGKRYIIHRVDEGQTLFSIARRYHVSVDQLKSANPDIGAAVRYAQIVRVPIPDGALTRKEARQMDRAIRKEEMMKPAVKAPAKPTAEPPVAVTKPAKPDAKSAVAARKTATRPARPADEPDKAGIHVVQSGQTLYSLAVRYGVPQAELRKWNTLSSDNVLIGQALIVSERAYQDRLPVAQSAANAKPTDRPERTDRVDREGAPDNVGAADRTDRTERNGRPVAKAEPAAKPAPKAEPREEKPESRSVATRPNPVKPDRTDVPTSRTEPKDEKRDDKPVAKRTDDAPATKPEPAKDAAGTAEPEPEPPRAGNDAPLPTRGRRIATTGVAEMIDGADRSGKYLALHRTAPIGTLVLVRNAFNNQSVWVKVIGRLPDTGVNDKILVKLSQQAFAKLSPEDRRFRAEVSYIVK